MKKANTRSYPIWVVPLAAALFTAPICTRAMQSPSPGNKHFDEKKNHPGANCVPYSAPVFMITPDLKRITKGDGVILIDGEFDGARRIVHMDVSTHDGAPVSLQGHSVGRWEGKTLVIDTTHFTDNAVGNAYGLRSGARKHLVERLTPDGHGALTYHFELSDPEFLAAPVAGDVQWVSAPI
jgi:hypothetical protein